VAITGCAGNVAPLVERADWAGLSTSLLSCLSATYGRLAPAVAGIVVELNPSANPATVGNNTAKVFGKIWQLWAAREAFRVGWNLGEATSDLGFETSAFQARLIMAVRQPTLGRMVLSPTGLGGLQLGIDPARGPANASILKWDESRCEFPFDDPEPGRWVADYPPIMSPWGNEVLPFSVEVTDGRITRIDVWSPDPRTSAGVGVGSSIDELRAAYGDSLRPGENTGTSSTWLVSGDQGILVFEVAEPTTDGYWPTDEVFGHVILARVIAQGGLDQGAAVIGTDDSAGAC
jgi:hypothetical protein